MNYINLIVARFKLIFNTKISLREKGVIRNSAGAVFDFGMNQIAILITFPIIINGLGPSVTGVWLTIGSLLAWMWMCDLGIGQGLMNRLSTQIARGTKSRQISFIFSTGFITQFLVISIATLVILVVNRYINWTYVFGYRDQSIDINFNRLIEIVVILSAISMQFQIASTAFRSMGNGDIYSLWVGMGNLVLILMLFGLKNSYLDIERVALITIGIKAIAQICAFFHLLYKYPIFKPKCKYFHKSFLKSMVQVSGWFLLAQVGGLLMQNSQNIIISHAINVSEVPIFSIIFRIASIPILIYMLIMSGLMPAYREAQSKNDWKWVYAIFIKSLKISVPIFLFSLALLLLTPIIIKIWIGKEYDPSIYVIIWLIIYILVNTIGTCLSALAYSFSNPRIASICALTYGIGMLFIGYKSAEKYGLSGLCAYMAIGQLFLNIIPLGIYIKYKFKNLKINVN